MLIFSFILRRVFFYLLRRKINFKGGGKSVLFCFFFNFFASCSSLCFIERPEMSWQIFISSLTNSKFRNGAGQGGERSQGVVGMREGRN